MNRSLATPRFLGAVQQALLLHDGQYRKGTMIPYAAHLLSVCSLVIVDGGDEDEAIAALFHDALEDQPDRISPDEIAQCHGLRVLELVQACSDTPPGFAGGPKPPWRDRKTSYLQHLGTSDPSARRVALADKLDNLRSTVADLQRSGASTWDRFNAGREDQLWFYGALRELFRSTGPGGVLMDEFDHLVDRLQQVA